jgi:hypothetical protein
MSFEKFFLLLLLLIYRTASVMYILHYGLINFFNLNFSPIQLLTITLLVEMLSFRANMKTESDKNTIVNYAIFPWLIWFLLWMMKLSIA